MADFLCLPLLRKAVFTAEIAARSHCQWCPPLVLSGHSIMSHLMSLSGEKPTIASDPKRTSAYVSALWRRPQRANRNCHSSLIWQGHDVVYADAGAIQRDG